MEIIEGTYKSDDGKDYYNLALNLQNSEKILIKNAGCTAAADCIALKYWGIKNGLYAIQTVKLFFLGSSPEISADKIPKKYHKIVFNSDSKN